MRVYPTPLFIIYKYDLKIVLFVCDFDMFYKLTSFMKYNYCNNYIYYKHPNISIKNR